MNQRAPSLPSDPPYAVGNEGPRPSGIVPKNEHPASRAMPPAETCRMFENELLERFSRIHPATPFVAWVPVALFFVTRSALREDLRWSTLAGLVVLGFLTWTLAEYFLHRYVFHWQGESKLAKRIHFLLHGVHHEYPQDKDRLVMPLLTSVPLALIFFVLFRLTLGRTLGEPFFAGFVAGYLMYDGTHYAVHHFKMRSRYAKWVKRHHMLHHHADKEGGFGVSSPLWDIVFRSLPVLKKRTS